MKFITLKNTHISIPFLKFIPCKVLEYEITFHKNCEYEHDGLPCKGDLNKLFYIGDFWDQHQNGASFRWKYDNGFEIWWGLHFNGVQCHQSGLYGKVYTAKFDEPVRLKIDAREGVKWYVNDLLVAEREEQLKQRFITGMWFGGGPLSDKCTAPHKMTMDVKFKKQK